MLIYSVDISRALLVVELSMPSMNGHIAHGGCTSLMCPGQTMRDWRDIVSLDRSLFDLFFAFPFQQE
jgi:hypothetical protein